MIQASSTEAGQTFLSDSLAVQSVQNQQFTPTTVSSTSRELINCFRLFSDRVLRLLHKGHPGVDTVHSKQLRLLAWDRRANQSASSVV